MPSRPMYFLVGQLAAPAPSSAVPVTNLPLKEQTAKGVLLQCDICGSIVPDGRGRRQHDQWHKSLEAATGDLGVRPIRVP